MRSALAEVGQILKLGQPADVDPDTPTCVLRDAPPYAATDWYISLIFGRYRCPAGHRQIILEHSGQYLGTFYLENENALDTPYFELPW